MTSSLSKTPRYGVRASTLLTSLLKMQRFINFRPCNFQSVKFLENFVVTAIENHGIKVDKLLQADHIESGSTPYSLDLRNCKDGPTSDLFVVNYYCFTPTTLHSKHRNSRFNIETLVLFLYLPTNSIISC